MRTSLRPRLAWMVVAAGEMLARVRYDTIAAPASAASTAQRTPVGRSGAEMAGDLASSTTLVTQPSRKRCNTFDVIRETCSSTRMALGHVIEPAEKTLPPPAVS